MLSVPNFDNGDTAKIEKGMVFAVEPFASTGAGIVQDSGIATVFELANKKPVRNVITRQVLKEIESYENLPFTTRWLTEKFGEGKTKLALRELKTFLHAHAPLVERSKGMTTVWEKSMLITANGCEVITRT